MGIGGLPVISWDFDLESGDSTITPEVSNPAYDTVRTRWFGSDGSELGAPQYADWRPGDDVLAQVPEGAVLVQISLIDQMAPGGGPHDSPALRPIGPYYFAPALVWTIAVAFDDGPVTDYVFQITDTHEWEALDALLEPVISYGPGIVLPPKVQMVQWVTYDLEPDGLHVTSGTDGMWTRVDIDVNEGAWTSSLEHLARYALESWDMVSFVVPFEALDLEGDTRNSVHYDFEQLDRPSIRSETTVRVP